MLRDVVGGIVRVGDPKGEGGKRDEFRTTCTCEKFAPAGEIFFSTAAPGSFDAPVSWARAHPGGAQIPGSWVGTETVLCLGRLVSATN